MGSGRTGHSIVLPLVDCALSGRKEIDLGAGVRLIQLSKAYRDKLIDDPILSSGYSKSTERISVGLAIQPGALFQDETLWLNEEIALGIFAALTLRLTCEVPIDIPFWFDVAGDGDILGAGRTLVRTFRSTPRYTYPLDKGVTLKRIAMLKPHCSSLLRLYRAQSDTNRVIKALEFAGIGFQTFHIPTRLVNQVTFMEVLFSTDIQELSFQLASRISWYLGENATPDEREKLFESVKAIYGMRSKVVHGGESSGALKSQMRQRLDEAETTNSEIFRAMLQRDQLSSFSQKGRAEQLRKLSLGLPCAFLER